MIVLGLLISSPVYFLAAKKSLRSTAQWGVVVCTCNPGGRNTKVSLVYTDPGQPRINRQTPPQRLRRREGEKERRGGKREEGRRDGERERERERELTKVQGRGGHTGLETSIHVQVLTFIKYESGQLISPPKLQTGFNM